MNSRSVAKTGGGLAIGAGLAALGYAGLVTYHRDRYGTKAIDKNIHSRLLDRFIPAPEVIEHHHVRIAAPADLVLRTARNMELLNSRLVRSVIRARELALGGKPDDRPHPKALVPQMLSIGWVVLAECADREIALGAVTQPWDVAPVFRSISSGDYPAFREPGYVKIAWTLRVEAVGDAECVFHTETRAATTDLETGKRFRTYWSFVAPGVELIRLAILRPLKRAAEKAFRADGQSVRRGYQEIPASKVSCTGEP